MDEARSVRDYWFGQLPLSAPALDSRLRFWFADDSGAEQRQRDAEIGMRFGELCERAVSGQLADWADGPRRRLSLIILLDQFPRNMFRGSARAFAGDGQALPLALSGMQSAADAALDVVERLFFYMPLQHAENREVQEESIAAYRRLLNEAPAELRACFAAALEWAERHQAIIEQFGRFPSRNAALGRESTPAEQQWLEASGETFGQ
jgi:uncharacterized protein (DUF924 family)